MEKSIAYSYIAFVPCNFFENVRKTEVNRNVSKYLKNDYVMLLYHHPPPFS
jgi:hypothetical protein